MDYSVTLGRIRFIYKLKIKLGRYLWKLRSKYEHKTLSCTWGWRTEFSNTFIAFKNVSKNHFKYASLVIISFLCFPLCKGTGICFEFWKSRVIEKVVSSTHTFGVPFKKLTRKKNCVLVLKKGFSVTHYVHETEQSFNGKQN